MNKSFNTIYVSFAQTMNLRRTAAIKRSRTLAEPLSQIFGAGLALQGPLSMVFVAQTFHVHHHSFPQHFEYWFANGLSPLA